MSTDAPSIPPAPPRAPQPSDEFLDWFGTLNRRGRREWLRTQSRAIRIKRFGRLHVGRTGHKGKAR